MGPELLTWGLSYSHWAWVTHIRPEPLDVWVEAGRLLVEEGGVVCGEGGVLPQTAVTHTVGPDLVVRLGRRPRLHLLLGLGAARPAA